jgi:hypothetical protein
MKNNQGLALISLTSIVIVAIVSLTMTINSGQIEFHIKLPGGIEIGSGSTKPN